jgi:hypothetical protein
MSSADIQAWLRQQISQINADLAASQLALNQAKEALAQAAALLDLSVNTAGSLTGGGALRDNPVLQLVNDQDNVPPNSFYSTDVNGTRGWFTLSAVGVMFKSDYDQDDNGQVDIADSVPDEFLLTKFNELYAPLITSMIYGATQPGVTGTTSPLL